MGWRGHYAKVHAERDIGPLAWLIILTIVVLTLVWISSAFAFDVVAPSQHGRSWNGLAISAANTAVSLTITPQASERARLSGASAFCSGGSASLSVTNGGSFSRGWVSSPGLFGTNSGGIAWTPTPFTGDLGAALVVTLGACGGGNVGTLTIQADTYAP